MIGFLRGIVIEKQAPWLLLDVNGVGYEIQAPMTTFYRLPDIGVEVGLRTHLVVREDAQLLYGFADEPGRALFRELIKVNGVGPKMALAILSALEVDELIDCVQRDNITTLVRVPGIGRKTAERLLVELRDRVSHWHHGLPLSDTQKIAVAHKASASAVQDDAVSALLALGYKTQEAEKAVASILQQHGADSHVVDSSEQLIRLALKSMLVR